MKQEGTRKRRLRGNVTLLDEEKMEKNMNAENEKNTFPTSHKYQGLKGVNSRVINLALIRAVFSLGNKAEA